MSQAAPVAHQGHVIEAEQDVETYFAALEDASCRAILDATSGRSLSASEISEECELPLSTTYRKLELLTDAGMLTESIRIRQSGKHTSEYESNVDDLTVSIDADQGVVVRVTHREPPATDSVFHRLPN